MKIKTDFRLERLQIPKVKPDELRTSQLSKTLKTSDLSKTCNTYKFSQLNNNTYTLYNIESKIKIAGAPND